MHSYLITPKFMLGADSFWVQAEDQAGAIEKAKARIKKEEWYSPHGWDVLQELADFADEEESIGPGEELFNRFL